jgi:HAD superfamily hydrolase (TIGR01509 family)
VTALRGLILDYGGVLTDGPEMAELPARARAAGLRVALLSDAHSVPAEYAARFDAVVLGGATGARKPDPEAFRRTAERLGLAPGDCVVVDDLPVNVRGASAAGAVGVRHTDPDATLRELEILFDW